MTMGTFITPEIQVLPRIPLRLLFLELELLVGGSRRMNHLLVLLSLMMMMMMMLVG